MPGFVSPVYLVMFVGGQKHYGNGALRIRQLKACGPGPSGLGLQSSDRPRARFTASLYGSARIHVVCCRTADVVFVSGLMPVADDATSILVRIGSLVYQRSVWSRHPVGPWRGCRTPSRA